MVRAAAAGVEAGGPGPFSGADGSAVALDAESAPLPLFDFPPILDDRVVRLVGVLVSSHKLTWRGRMAGFSLRSPLHAAFKAADACSVGRSASPASSAPSSSPRTRRNGRWAA